jgi:hypothetical protein
VASISHPRPSLRTIFSLTIKGIALYCSQPPSIVWEFDIGFSSNNAIKLVANHLEKRVNILHFLQQLLPNQGYRKLPPPRFKAPKLDPGGCILEDPSEVRLNFWKRASQALPRKAHTLSRGNEVFGCAGEGYLSLLGLFKEVPTPSISPTLVKVTFSFIFHFHLFT